MPGANVATQSTKRFQEQPKTRTAEKWNCQIVVPAPQIDEFGNAGNQPGAYAHDNECCIAGDNTLIWLPTQHFFGFSRQSKPVLEHEGIDGIVGKRTDSGSQLAPKEEGSDNTHDEGREGARERLAFAQANSVASVKATEGACGRIAPRQKQDGDDTNVLGIESKGAVCSDQIPNDTIVAVYLCLAHQSAQNFDVESVKSFGMVPEDICRPYDGECAQQPGCYGPSLCPIDVETESEEPY